MNRRGERRDRDCVCIGNAVRLRSSICYSLPIFLFGPVGSCDMFVF